MLDAARLRTDPAYYTQRRHPELFAVLTGWEREEVQAAIAWRFNLRWEARHRPVAIDSRVLKAKQTLDARRLLSRW